MSDLVYTTVDKSEWGPGEWQDEPDKIQWKDEETGLPCLIKRGPAGAWCGYVGLAPGHSFYEKDYSFVYEMVGWDELSVHGGLTYSDHCAEGPEESGICHVPEPGEPDNVWWLGFDCSHSFDLSPASKARERQRYEETGDPIWLPFPGSEQETYRTVDYARAETRSLARQLAQTSVEGSVRETLVRHDG